MAISEYLIVVALLDKILGLITEARDEVEKVRKENEKILEDALAALARGDIASLNQLINKLIL